MTAIGKLLVFLNLFAAVALVTWAVSLSANRLDWVDREADGQKVEGEITKLKAEIAAAVKAITEASAGYGRQEAALADAESGVTPEREGRDRRRAVFAARIQACREGVFRTQLQLPGRVLIDVAREGDVIKGPNGQPLEGINVTQKKLDDALKDTRAAVDQIDKSRAEFARLSAEIKDTDARIEAQRELVANLADEQKFLAGVQITWDEDLRTLERRHKQLERRLNAVRAVTATPAPAGGPAGG